MKCPINSLFSVCYTLLLVMFTCKLLKICDDVIVMLPLSDSNYCTAAMKGDACTNTYVLHTSLPATVSLFFSHPVLVYHHLLCTWSVPDHIFHRTETWAIHCFYEVGTSNSEDLRWRSRRNQHRDKASRTVRQHATYDRSVHHEVLALDVTLSSIPSSKACRSTAAC